MKLFFALLLSLTVIGCTDNGVKNDISDASSGNISFTLSKAALPSNIATLTFTLTKQPTGEIVSKTITVSTDTTMHVAFNQLAIGTWLVKVVAKDSATGKQYAGESYVSVLQGEVTQVNLFLTLTASGTGALNIIVNWEGTSPFYDYQSNPVLQKTGSWYDQVGVAYPSILNDNGKIKMWFMNYGISSSAGTYGSIGLAESIDGTTWTRVSDTTFLPSPGTWDGQIIVPGTVIKENGVYMMYYFGSNRAGGVFYIGMATSSNGRYWTKKPDPILSLPNVAGAGVVKANGQFFMYYNTSPSTSVQLATSQDGFTWQPYQGNPVMTPSQAWESTRITCANVIFENNVFTMLYYDNAYSVSYGLATSTDGIHWVKDARNPVFTKANTVNNWTPRAIGYPFLVRVGNELRIYYTGYMDNGVERIGFAIKR